MRSEVLCWLFLRSSAQFAAKELYYAHYWGTYN